MTPAAVEAMSILYVDTIVVGLQQIGLYSYMNVHVRVQPNYCYIGGPSTTSR